MMPAPAANRTEMNAAPELRLRRHHGEHVHVLCCSLHDEHRQREDGEASFVDSHARHH